MPQILHIFTRIVQMCCIFFVLHSFFSDYPDSIFYSGFYLKHIAQRGARTHDPEIKSLMLYRLS